MSVGRLIEFFSAFERFPVYAEDVMEQIVAMGIQDCIEFHPMKNDVSAEDLLGLYKRYRKRNVPYGDAENCSLIFYNVNISPEEQNFICVKELMHVFDDRLKAAVTNKDELEAHLRALFDKPLNRGSSPSAVLDKAAEFIALAVMFPSAVRLRCLDEISRGALSEPQVATEFGIPLLYVREVLSERWEPFVKMLQAL